MIRSIIRISVFLLACGEGWVSLAQPAPATRDEVERLKQQVAGQQEQINELRRLLEGQQTLPRAPQGTSSPPAIQRPAPAEATQTSPLPRDSAPPKAPLSLEVGGAAITPTGWLDFTQVWRSKTVTSGLPTNFAGIPFNNTVDGHRRQTLSSAANSRMGVRIDTKAFGFKVLGVVETDFLGYAPGNVSTTTNSNGMRLRLAFTDLHKGKWEVLGGQSWSLITPSRKGISPLGSTLFLTQDLDPNIMTGLTWARTPQVRVVYHPKESIALGVSFESANAYAGGSSGSGASTLPSALAPNYFGQIDTGGGGLGVPNANADLLAKIAFDPKLGDRSIHFEVAGLINRFTFYNPLNNQRFTKVGAGVAVNAGIEAVRHLTFFTNNFYSDGGGRFVFGQGPALIIRGDGAPSLVHTMATVDGFEYQATPKWKLFAYYGGTYVGRNVTIDPASGNPVGYGYPGSPNSHNKSIQEIAGGFQHVFWHNPNYGAFQFNGQYSWLVRHPWYVAPNQPKSANLNMLYLNIRYLLPGEPPASK